MEKHELFVRLPVSALLDSRLSRSALILYAILIDAADSCGICQGITIGAMAARTGLSEKTIRRAEAQLMRCSYIMIHRTGRASLIEVLHNLRPMLRSSIESFDSWKEAKVE